MRIGRRTSHGAARTGGAVVVVFPRAGRPDAPGLPVFVSGDTNKQGRGMVAALSAALGVVSGGADDRARKALEAARR